MKKIRILALTGILCMVLAGCTEQKEIKDERPDVEVLKEELVAEAKSRKEESVTEAVPASEADIVVDMDSASKIVTNEEGIELVRMQENYPVVTIGGREGASGKINEYYQKEKEEMEVLIKQYRKAAGKDYRNNAKNKETKWYPYELNRTHELARADSAVISVTCEDSAVTSLQAYGETTDSADNFNPETGEKLKFADVVTDEAAARIFMEDYIKKAVADKRKGQEVDYFLTDYAENVPTLLTEDTWYFSQKGFAVIANPFIISAGDAGSIVFTIPYKEFTYLKEEYK